MADRGLVVYNNKSKREQANRPLEISGKMTKRKKNSIHCVSDTRII